MYNRIFQENNNNNLFYINNKKNIFKIQKNSFTFLNFSFFNEIDNIIYKPINEENKNKLRKNLKCKIKLIISAQEAKLGAPLSPILSQYNINVKDFVDFFNENTKNYEIGYSLPIIIYLYKDKNFDIIFKNFSTIKLLIDFFNAKRVRFANTLTTLEFYKFYLIQALNSDNFLLTNFCNNLIGSLNSWNFFFAIKNYKEKEHFLNFIF